MDRRKQQPPSYSAPPEQPPLLIDFGASPPWTLSPSYQESALRSTQFSPQPTVDPSRLHQRRATLQTNLSSFNALNVLPEAAPLAAPPTRKTIGKRNFKENYPAAADDDSEDDGDYYVDKENSNDGVYMINAKEGSWSAPLASELDPATQAELPHQAELALLHVQRARELEQAKQRTATAQANAKLIFQQENSIEAMKERARWQRDMLLRNAVRKLRQKISEGAVLILGRLQIDVPKMTCAHPPCQAPGSIVPIGAYYVTLVHPHAQEPEATYCLFCLEGLWAGTGIVGELPDARVYPREEQKQTDPSLNLDGSSEAAPPGNPDSTPAFSSPARSRPTSSHNASTPVTQYSTPSSSLALTFSGAPTYEVQSPLARKYKLLPTQQQDKDIELFKSKLQRTQPPTTLNRRSVASRSVRRSARLNQVTGSANIKPEAVSNSRDIVASKRERQPESNRVLKDTRRAEEKLQNLYERRRKSLPLLEPGDRLMLEQRKCAISKVGARIISMDSLGVVYTDLLADHVKSASKPVTRGRSTQCGQTSNAVAGPMPDLLCSSPWLEEEISAEHWCTCRGEEDGRKMILCSNEVCLVGWYHLECIGVVLNEEGECIPFSNTAFANDEATLEDWLCLLCTSQTLSDGVVPESPVNPKHINSFFAPAYAKLLEEAEYQKAHANTAKHLPFNLDGQTKLVAAVQQLDGVNDYPQLPYQPAKPSPLIQAISHVPESLLSSKHAPKPNERQDTPVPEVPLNESPSPIAVFPATPGSLAGSEDSTTSTGAWLQPVTRFQYLAEFIEVGDSLDDVEKAAVELWKAASKEQLDWDKHRERSEQLASHFAMLLEDRDEKNSVETGEGFGNGQSNANEMDQLSENRLSRTEDVRISEGFEHNGADVESDQETHEAAMQATAKISKQDCRGKDLTAVLADVRYQAMM